MGIAHNYQTYKNCQPVRAFRESSVLFREARVKWRICVFLSKERESKNGALPKAGRDASLLRDRRSSNVAKTGNETGHRRQILLEIRCVQLHS